MTHLKQLTHLTPRLAAIALLLGASAMPAMAASSTSSAASDGVSASVGSLSGSVEQSSASSAGDKKVAEGDYRIIDVAAAADRPGVVRMKLQAMATEPGARSAEGEFFLYLPQTAFDASRLAQGGVVTARSKPYGTEFADAQTRQAFFLVLADHWYKELHTTPVAL
jgi:hypothetical protein